MTVLTSAAGEPTLPDPTLAWCREEKNSCSLDPGGGLAHFSSSWHLHFSPLPGPRPRRPLREPIRIFSKSALFATTPPKPWVTSIWLTSALSFLSWFFLFFGSWSLFGLLLVF